MTEALELSCWHVLVLAIAGSLPNTLSGQSTDPPTRPADAAGLRTALAEVRSAMDAAQWSKASDALAATLKRFEGSDRVRRMRSEIIALDRRCRFHATYQPPELQSLVSGKILRYLPKSGLLKIRYDPSSMRDFRYADQLQPRKTQGKKTKGLPFVLEMPRRRSRADYRFHPAVFQEYRVTLTGESYSRASFLVCVNEDSAHQIEVGVPPFSRAYGFGNLGMPRRPDFGGFGKTTVRWLPTTFHRLSGPKSSKQLAKKEWGAHRKPPKKLTTSTELRKWYARKVKYPVEDGEPFKLELSVSATRIVLKSRGRTMVACTKGRTEHGRFALRGPRFSRIEFSGTVDRSWLQNELDARRIAALGRFERSYRARKHLPKWLFAPVAAEGPSAAASRGDRPYPGDVRPDAREMNRANADLRAHNYRTLLFRLTFTGRRKMPDAVRTYLRARAFLGLGLLDKAEAQARACYAYDKEYYWTPIVLALIAGRQRRSEQETTWYRRAIALLPRRAEAYSYWANSLLWRGRTAAAGKVLVQAMEAGVTSKELASAEAILRKIKSGPDWARRFAVETRHFRIASDIDEKTCRDAGIVLEQAHAVYAGKLGKVDTGGRRFQVYIFAGRAGFDRYCSGLRMDVPVHTAGLYSPRLKQLLIWNLANRHEMLRTIRHEGLHQYVDVLLKSPPTWLNEGLAEYFEQARTLRGKPVAGLVQERHLRALALIRRDGRPRLAELMRLPHQAFYIKARTNYPMSWALVHFLRHTTRANRKVFDALLAGLKAGEPYPELLKRTLSGVDAKALDQDYWAYVQQLRAKRR